MNNEPTRKIKLHLEREEHWYPVVEVPVDMTDDEALAMIEKLQSELVYDEMNNKNTFDFGCVTASVHCSANDDAEARYNLIEEAELCDETKNALEDWLKEQSKREQEADQ